MAGERTEQPTTRRLREARDRGQIARSRDFTQALQLGATVIGLSLAGPYVVDALGQAVRDGLSGMSGWAHRGLRFEDVASLLSGRAIVYASIVGPLALLSAAVVVAASAGQGGWVWATEALTLNFANLSPSQGLQRLIPGRAIIELLKTTAVAAIVGWICWGFVAQLIGSSEPLARMSPLEAAATGWDVAVRMVRRCALVLVLLSGVDYAYQRWRLTQSLMMTKEEVKDDSRLAEGNPETKARIRRIQREIARRRMLAAVPKATVVVTNPTHFAVALQYRREAMSAPVVVAKGQDKLAERIKAIAREHGVPLVENKPLAQALYRNVEVGEQIPGELFEAVAEVLAYLIRLKQLVI